MKFIQLTLSNRTDKPPFTVRADTIIAVTPVYGGRRASIALISGDVTEVDQSADEVLALINGPAPAVYDKKETALILAGLRMLQQRLDSGLSSSIDDILLDAYKRAEYNDLDADIDQLCEKVNG